MCSMQESKGLYEALKSKDTRFDGRFFVGVSSTGIYCRPVCKAKVPKFENCTFYESAAMAEQAGYRPCLLCRPELAPGYATTDATKMLAHRAARYLEENCSKGMSLDKLASKLGYTDRHLRRVFQAEYQVSPVQYRETCRLLLAKNLLTDTTLSVAHIAKAVGFGSLRRFNDSFKGHYRLSPSALRKQTTQKQGCAQETTLLLGYRPPYCWSEMLAFLAGRAIQGVEAVVNGEYLRTVLHTNAKGEQVSGWIKVGMAPRRDTLAVTVSPSLLKVLPQVLARVRHLFDLYCEPRAVADVLESMNELKAGLFTPGVRVPGCYDAFEMVARTILGQQITVKAASTLAGRLVRAYGQEIQTGIEGLDLTFPTPAQLVAMGSSITDKLGVLGIIAARSKSLQALAQALVEDAVDLNMNAHPETEMAKLLALPGIGPWSAQYIAMRAMGWTDAFLATDYGVKKALKAFPAAEVDELSKSWQPWRSYATISLWNSL